MACGRPDDQMVDFGHCSLIDCLVIDFWQFVLETRNENYFGLMDSFASRFSTDFAEKQAFGFPIFINRLIISLTFFKVPI